VIPATLGAEGVVPTEFMLFLVRGTSSSHHCGTLICYRATLSTPIPQSTMEIPNTRTVVSIGAITTVRASAGFTSDFVRP
jgi:hypothetical protein